MSTENQIDFAMKWNINLEKLLLLPFGTVSSFALSPRFFFSNDGDAFFLLFLSIFLCSISFLRHLQGVSYAHLMDW